ncbi:MAG: N-acetylmuramoyl-L-alanine amidase, partial [Bacteroidia bacterium]
MGTTYTPEVYGIEIQANLPYIVEKSSFTEEEIKTDVRKSVLAFAEVFDFHLAEYGFANDGQLDLEKLGQIRLAYEATLNSGEPPQYIKDNPNWGYAAMIGFASDLMSEHYGYEPYTGEWPGGDLYQRTFDQDFKDIIRPPGYYQPKPTSQPNTGNQTSDSGQTFSTESTNSSILHSNCEGWINGVRGDTDYGPAFWIDEASQQDFLEDPITPYIHLNQFIATGYGTCNSLCSGNNESKDAVIIHAMEGRLVGALTGITYFCSVGGAAHYYMGLSRDGGGIVFLRVIQISQENKYMSHATGGNTGSIGIEHEGFSSGADGIGYGPDNRNWFADLYAESANLVKDIQLRHPAIAAKPDYSGPAYANKKTSSINSKFDCLGVRGHIQTNGGTHWDPGPNWDWAYYYSLINTPTSVLTYTASNGIITSPGFGIAGYLPGLNREYVIDVPVGGIATLIIDEFDLNFGDYVFIYDDPYPTIEANPHNNESDMGFGSNQPTDVPVANFCTGQKATLTNTTFTSNKGGFRVIFRSDCIDEAEGFKMSWTDSGCSFDMTNNTQTTATLLSGISGPNPNSLTIQRCIDWQSLDEDWYSIPVNTPGLLTVTLANQANNFNLEFYDSFGTLIDYSYNNSTQNESLYYCSAGLSCGIVYVRVYPIQSYATPGESYDLILNWHLISCTPGTGNLTVNETTTEPTESVVMASASPTNVCPGNSSSITMSGATQYTLSGPGGIVCSPCNGNSVTVYPPTTPGTYIYTASDYSDPCGGGDATVNITVQNAPVANAGPDLVSAGPGSPVTLQGSYINGNSPSYLWLPGV